MWHRSVCTFQQTTNPSETLKRPCLSVVLFRFSAGLMLPSTPGEICCSTPWSEMWKMQFLLFKYLTLVFHCLECKYPTCTTVPLCVHGDKLHMLHFWHQDSCFFTSSGGKQCRSWRISLLNRVSHLQCAQRTQSSQDFGRCPPASMSCRLLHTPPRISKASVSPRSRVRFINAVSLWKIEQQ